MHTLFNKECFPKNRSKYEKTKMQAVPVKIILGNCSRMPKKRTVTHQDSQLESPQHFQSNSQSVAAASRSDVVAVETLFSI